ncbi:hypothetical protein O181_132494, partial [Austropuccinia psidii MF-1]|nr:hypothetical protein [Austropuccinia psidii MF-1]
MANCPILGSYGEQLIKEDQINSEYSILEAEDDDFNKQNLWHLKDTSSTSRSQELQGTKELLKIMQISDKTNNQIVQELMDQLNFKPLKPILKTHTA